MISYASALRGGAFLCVFLFATSLSYSQDRSRNVWIFGDNIRMDFSSGNPVYSVNQDLDGREAVASICDPVTGALLLYASGNRLWNGNGQLISSTLLTGRSANQGVMIVPTGEKGRYFVFTTDEREQGDDRRGAHYSIVDLSLNNGRGGIVDEARNILLIPNSSEGMAATHHDNLCSFWLLLHAQSENKIFAFLVEGESIQPPVITILDSGPNNGPFSAEIKVSPDGSKVALSRLEATVELMLMDFDNTTGLLSNARIIRDGNNRLDIGIEFSADSKKLYFGSNSGTQIALVRCNQLDSPNPSESITTVFVDPPRLPQLSFRDMETGPDGRIYCLYRRTSDLVAFTIIEDPDSPAPFVRTRDVPDGLMARWGLPTFYSGYPIERSAPVDKVLQGESNMRICAGDEVELNVAGGFRGYFEWLAAPGIEDPRDRRQIVKPLIDTWYYLEYSAVCQTRVDSVLVEVLPAPDVSVEIPDELCLGASTMLIASGAESYRWEPATGLDDPFSATPLASPTETTRYTVTGQNAAGCSVSAEVTVVVRQALTLNAVPVNPTICDGQSVSVAIESKQPLESIRWEPATGVADPNAAETEVSVSETTTFQILAKGLDGCVDSISVTVFVDEFTTVRLEPDLPQACAGEDLQVQLLSDIPLSSVRWSPATGLSNPMILNPIVNLSASQTYTIEYTSEVGCRGELSIFVEVLDLPQISVANALLELCPGAGGTVTAIGAENYSWFDQNGVELANTATWQIPASQASGMYLLVGQNAAGCSEEVSVEIVRLNAPVAPEPLELTICPGESVQLPSSGGVRYRWSPSIGLDDVNSPNPIASPDLDQEYQLEVFNAEGCSALTSVRVNVTPQLLVELDVESPGEQLLPGDIIDVTLSFRLSAELAASNAAREFRLSIDHPANALRYVENSLTNSPNLFLSTLGLNQHLALNQLQVEGRRDAGPLPREFSITFQMRTMLLTEFDTTVDIVLSDVSAGFAGECVSFTGEHALNWSEICLQSQRGLVISGGRFALQQPVPNPVAGKAQIVYSLGFDCDVELLLIDNLGRVLKTLVNERQNSGMQTLEIETGELAAGNYRYVLRAGPFKASRMLLVR